MASVLNRSAPKAPAEHGYPFALWAFWAYIVVAVARLGEVVPGLGSIPLAKIAVAACLAGIAFSRHKLNPNKLLDQPMPRTALAIFLLAGASVAFSIWLSATVIYFFTAALVVAVGFVLTLKLFNNRRALITTLFVLVVTGLVQAVAAILSQGGRVAAEDSSYDTNDLAYLLVTILPIAIAFAIKASSRLKKVAWLAVCGFFLLVIFLTQSRGGFLGLIGVGGFFVFRPMRYQRDSPAKNKQSGLLTRLAVVVASGLVVWVALPGQAKTRLLTVFSLESDYNADTTLKTGRLAIWERNVKAVIGRPIGFGLNTFGAVDMRYGGKFKAPHNSLIQALVELGFLGLFLYLRMYWLAWRALSKPRQDDRDGAIFCHALQASLIGNFISGFFLSQAYSNLIWTLFAVAMLCGLQFTDAGVIAKQPAGRRRA